MHAIVTDWLKGGEPKGEKRREERDQVINIVRILSFFLKEGYERRVWGSWRENQWNDDPLSFNARWKCVNVYQTMTPNNIPMKYLLESTYGLYFGVVYSTQVLYEYYSSSPKIV